MQFVQTIESGTGDYARPLSHTTTPSISTPRLGSRPVNRDTRFLETLFFVP